MKYIANILTSDPFSASELYNVTTERDSLIGGIPTLIIGWERAKSEYPDASIIDWKLDDDTYWTYGKYERRDKFEENTKRFGELALKKFIDKVEYVFYDVIIGGEERFKKFKAAIMEKSDLVKMVYISMDMVYIYFGDETPRVFGVSLRDCDYLGPEYKKWLFSAIYSNPGITVLKNNDAISREVRYKMKNREYMLPYLFS